MLIALVVLGLLVVGGFVAIVFIGLGKVEHDQRKAERNAEASLDALFDGTPDVTFIGHMRTMKFQTVVLGAKKRGYKLAHQAGDPGGAFTLIFEKA